MNTSPRTADTDKDKSAAEAVESDADEKINWRERLRHFTWAQFTFSLSTGGIGLLLASTPHRFTGLDTIGKIVFILALVVFIAASAAITFRFAMFPGTFKNSLVHPTEGLFVPTVLLTVANIIGCSQVYGSPHCGPWFAVTMRVLFWIYCAISFLAAVVQMIGGTLAQLIAPSQTPAQRMPIIVAGVAFQGLGWMVAFLMYAAYVHRLMGYGLPAPNLRPGMFISVGPPSFTGLALIGLADALPQHYGYFAVKPHVVETLQAIALFVAIFLWVLGIWFFCVTVVAVLLKVRQMCFHLVWWSFVFPNVGFTIATIKIGQQLQSEGILWVASAMTILLVMMWIFVLGSQIRAVWRRDIMMPGKDEDKECFKDDDEKHGVASPP